MPAPRLYVDSADVDAVSPLLSGSLVHGVTTNPTILERAGRTVADIPELYARWAGEGAREIFFQAWGDDEAALERRAREILALGGLGVVKVPATRVGFGVAARLAREGAPVLLTAVFTPAQALAAASCGIRYIAAYMGRTRDAGYDLKGGVSRMHRLCEGGATEVMAASLRSAEEIVALAEAGVPVFTASPSVVWELIENTASVEAAAAFEASPSLRP
ncbi:transaldolase family protein [Agrococcus sediminis]|uniref:transaldolase family protein n=1 Tax=Agrococcus sediminis TaxID=2599924 RepID=UPI003448A86E